jgi:hypothetical protein
MTTDLSPASTRTFPRRRHRLLAGTTVTLGLLAAASLPAWACPPNADSSIQIPARGAPVTCDGTGMLTGSGGYLVQSETTRIDQRGRAHVLFTISAHHVSLTSGGVAGYRLRGGGFDRVIYRTSDISGDIVREDEAFRFDVIGPGGVVGVVRFRLHTGPNGTPLVHDTSTCQLPNMS